jgi:hypothetical protein
MTEMGETMSALLEEAETKGLWLYTSYQDLWFSPAQLREHQANGRFRWGVVNWRLRDPQEMVQNAERDVATAQMNLDRVRALVTGRAR